jgi:hypothetical protein
LGGAEREWQAPRLSHASELVQDLVPVGNPMVRDTLVELVDCGPKLGPGEMGAEALVGAHGESDVVVAFPLEIDLERPVESAGPRLADAQHRYTSSPCLTGTPLISVKKMVERNGTQKASWNSTCPSRTKPLISSSARSRMSGSRSAIRFGSSADLSLFLRPGKSAAYQAGTGRAECRG